MLSYIPALVFPFLIGLLFIGVIAGYCKKPNSFLLVCCFLSIGIGIGITSCLTFVLLFSGGLSGQVIVIVETLSVITLGYLCFYRFNRSDALDLRYQSSFNVLRGSGIQKTLAVVFCLTLALSLVIFALKSWRHPHGGWDAFAIWNLRARFLFRGGLYWRDAFSEHLFWSHPDYPLLIPTSIARGWAILGDDTVAIPIFLALLFTFGIVGLLVSALSTLRSTSQGLLAGAVLLGTPFYINLGASQLADIPLAFFVLATVVLLNLKDSLPGFRSCFLAGISAGFCAWVKNEGSLILLALLLVSLVTVFLSQDPKGALKQLMAFFLGALPVLIVLILFKMELATANDLVSKQSFHSIVAKLTDPDRHFTVLREFERRVRNFGGWVFSMPVMLVFYILVLGLHSQINAKEEVILPLVAMTLVLGGYYLVYIYLRRMI